MNTTYHNTLIIRSLYTALPTCHSLWVLAQHIETPAIGGWDESLYSAQMLAFVGSAVLSVLVIFVAMALPFHDPDSKSWHINQLLTRFHRWLEQTQPQAEEDTELVARYDCLDFSYHDEWLEFVQWERPLTQQWWVFRASVHSILLLLAIHIEGRMSLSIPLASCFGLVIGVLLARA